MSFKKLSFIACIIAALAIIALVYVTFTYRAETPAPISNINTHPNPTITPIPTGTSGFHYDLVFGNINDSPMDDDTFDASIVQTNTYTGEQTTLVSSIKQAYPDIRGQFNLTLSKLSFPPGSNTIYFTKILSETDGSPMDIIAFNTETKQFNKLKISAYWQNFHPKETQKDGTLAFSAYNPSNPKDGQSLFLLDLATDQARLLHRLPLAETFNNCWQETCFGGFSGAITWFQNHTIYADIYYSDQTVTEPSTGRTTYKLKETLTIVPN